MVYLKHLKRQIQMTDLHDAEILSINHCYHIAWFENRGYNLRNVKRNKRQK